MKKIKLKSCPFCGKKAELRIGYEYEYYVKCTNDNCAIRAYTDTFQTQEEAVKVWNTRKRTKCSAQDRIVSFEEYIEKLNNRQT